MHNIHLRGTEPSIAGIVRFSFFLFLLTCLVPFAMWTAFPPSDYYGTADFLQSSLLCKAPFAGSHTFRSIYPFMCPLGRGYTPEDPAAV